jgi:pyruvate formate lyase activating enzyme
VDRDRCELAGACVEACLPGALEIVGRSRSVEELLRLLEADRLYYEESGGGVTFSGGEPFTQPEFLRELLLGCRERELPVTLDTSGHVPPETFRELAPLASHLLFDLKVMDEERHEAFTGVHNRWVLENLRWASSASARGGPILLVRVPLIPGINADEENLRATAAFLTGLEKVPALDLLPYHRLGIDKYGRMGKHCGLAETPPPDDGVIEEAVRILEDGGLTVTVRGEAHGNDGAG